MKISESSGKMVLSNMSEEVICSNCHERLPKEIEYHQHVFLGPNNVSIVEYKICALCIIRLYRRLDKKSKVLKQFEKYMVARSL